MADSDASSLSDVPAPLWETISLCAAGEISANVALMRLIMYSRDAVQAREAIVCVQDWLVQHGDAVLRSRVSNLNDLWAATPNAWNAVKCVLHGLPEKDGQTGSNSTISRWKDVFDQLADATGDVGVALYALGRIDLLDAATNEVIKALRRWNVPRNSQSILEIGCGTGRFIERLAPTAKRVIGVDVSSGMLRRARLRCDGLKQACFVQTTGRDLAAFSDASFDLVLAIDSFPYIVAAGGTLPEAYVAEVARVLTPNGIFLILNYSYRGDTDLDGRDVVRIASQNSFAILRHGTRDLALWDAVAYLLQLRH
jgi:SAM-dependent methyltransferase